MFYKTINQELVLLEAVTDYATFEVIWQMAFAIKHRGRRALVKLPREIYYGTRCDNRTRADVCQSASNVNNMVCKKFGFKKLGDKRLMGVKFFREY